MSTVANNNSFNTPIAAGATAASPAEVLTPAPETGSAATAGLQIEAVAAMEQPATAPRSVPDATQPQAPAVQPLKAVTESGCSWAERWPRWR